MESDITKIKGKNKETNEKLLFEEFNEKSFEVTVKTNRLTYLIIYISFSVDSWRPIEDDEQLVQCSQFRP